MIEVFNHLTSSELDDCDIFKSIIKCHYNKFRYFYNLINTIKFDNIDKIICIEHKNHLGISISVKENKYITDMRNIINTNSKKNINDLFIFNIEEIDCELHISVYNTESGGDNYENRLNQCQ